nr:MAG TPA: hypothetical protein [Caudoviricetes sp.]
MGIDVIITSIGSMSHAAIKQVHIYTRFKRYISSHIPSSVLCIFFIVSLESKHISVI